MDLEEGNKEFGWEIICLVGTAVVRALYHNHGHVVLVTVFDDY